MELIARFATKEDLGATAQLLGEAFAAVSSERGGPLFLSREGVPQPFYEALERSLSDPRSCLVVGTADGLPLGMALGRLESLGGGSLARLELLWVDAAVRELGIGAELMSLVVAWAKRKGASHLDAYALPGNREAKSFLETAGFSARLIVMSRALDGLAGQTPSGGSTTTAASGA